MKNKFWILILLVLLSFVLSIVFGSVEVNINELIKAIFDGPKNISTVTGRIFWYVRLPRTLACMLAGAGLSVSGLIVQNVLSNKMASPSILGVNAGAGLAVTICCALGIYSGWTIAGASFLGAMIAIMCITLLAQKIGASRSTILLIGIAINSFFNSTSEAISILFPDAGMQAADFRVGGFSAVSLNRIFPAAIIILICLILLFRRRNGTRIRLACKKGENIIFIVSCTISRICG